jgi:hypothetical protein
MIDIFILSDKVKRSLLNMRVSQPTPNKAVAWKYF